MADKSMKAVIWAEVDPTGVATGVAATNKELAKLNKTASRTSTMASISAGISIVQAGYGVLASLFNAVNARMDEIQAMSTKYGAGFVQAKMTEIERTRQAIALGTSTAVETTAIEANKRKNIQQETQRLSQITGGRAAMSVFTEDLKTAGNQLADFAGNVVGDPMGALSGKYRSQTGFFADFRNFYTGSTGAELAGGIGSNRGMATDTSMAEQTEVLKQIRDRLGGGR